MYRFVYTRCLEKADDVQTACYTGLTREEAKRCFDDKMREVLAQVLDNEYLNCTMNIHKMKAVIKEEGVRHVVAVIEEDIKCE